MFRRALLTFILCSLVFAAMATAQPAPHNTNLLQHHRVFQGRAVDQVAVLLELQLPANGWSTAAELQQAQVDAALDWLIDHGYLFDDPTGGIDFSSSSNGNTLTISGPGFETVIHLPSGPFLPIQREQLMVATIIRQIPNVSNGF